jgi:hypothetical protein
MAGFQHTTLGGAGLRPVGAQVPAELHRGVKEGAHGGTLGSPVTKPASA